MLSVKCQKAIQILTNYNVELMLEAFKAYATALTIDLSTCLYEQAATECEDTLNSILLRKVSFLQLN